METSLELAGEALNSSKRRADTLSAVESLMMQALALSALGRIYEFETKLNEAREGIESIDYRDVSWEILICSMQCLLHFYRSVHINDFLFAHFC